ncbi:MAG: hypothetical protein CMP59_10490 [Flavobacteriales bacterium]|nr:hypothetical protein [Flavobacteriales bacterium]|tara:strand:+ start:626 stop:952 length:327 start_codon:yes stop_codon:yes gene_type:complete
MNIGAKIKMRREELGMSVQQLSDMIGMTRQNVYNLENHDHIHTKTLESLCKALNIDLFWFFSEGKEDYLNIKEQSKKQKLNERINDIESMIRILQRELLELKEIKKRL